MHQPVKRPKHGRTRRFASCNPTVPYASRIWVRQDALVHASANKRLELGTGQVDRFTAVRILGPGNSDSGKARQETSRNCSQDQFNHIDSHKPKAHRCSRIWPSYPLSLPLSPSPSPSLSLSLGHHAGSESAAGAGKIGQSTDFATQAARTFAWHMSSPKSLLCLVQHTKLAQVHVCISGIRHPAFFLLWLLRFPVLCLIVCVCVNSQHNNPPAFKAAALIVAINHAACTLDS